MGVVDGIWFLWLQLGSGRGLTGRGMSKGFKPGSSCMVGQCWGLSEGGGSGGSSGTGVTVPGALSHSSAKPSARKRVRPGGSVGCHPGPLPH